MEIRVELRDHYERSCREVQRYETSYSGRYILGVQDVLDAHFMLADYFFERDEPMTYGIKSVQALVSCLDRQLVGYGRRTKWTSEFEIVATLYFGLIKNHAFHDGNKRTALLTVLHHLWICGRTTTMGQKKLELLTVAVADNKLKDRYRQFASYTKKEDPEVRFLAWFLRKNSRPIDRKDYVVTYRQLDAILKRHGYSLEHPKNNTIEVVHHQTVSRRVGLFKKEAVVEQRRVCTVGFPGWKTQVSKKDVKTIRSQAQLRPEDGVDSQVFFNDINPMGSFIATYGGPLRRLSHK